MVMMVIMAMKEMTLIKDADDDVGGKLDVSAPHAADTWYVFPGVKRGTLHAL